MATVGRVRMRRAGAPGPRGGGVYVSEFQRTRLLDATFAVVSEQGFKRTTVRRVSGRAGVSNKTFYDLFEDCEDCFLAAFDHAIEELATVVVPAFEGEKEWAARIRAGLGALLGVLDRDPELRRLVFIEALGAGPRVLQRRARVLQGLGRAIDEGHNGVRGGRELPPLTAEGVVGAVFGVIYGRLVEAPTGPVAGLSNALMATIVFPYRGHAAATRELAHLEPTRTIDSSSRVRRGTSLTDAGARRGSSDFRLTIRTQMVLAAVSEHPGVSNREVADAAGIADQGQISKLLARVEGFGLVRNAGGHAPGFPNAWHITSRGEKVLSLSLDRGALPSAIEEQTCN